MRFSKRRKHKLAGIVLLGALVATSLNTWAGPREQAKRLHDRLTGVPPTAAVLDSMAAQIAAGETRAAAIEAMANPAFYNTTLREFATPMTNREQSVFAPLNDAIATVIGLVRDEQPFDRLLYDDIVYVGSDQATNVPVASDNNDHFVDLQEQRVNLGDPAMLEQQTQSSLPGGLNANETAGILTSRGYGEAFLVAGTNRAAVRFATLNFLCLDMEDMRDVTAWPDRIRQDVTRSPGGDSTLFLNDCLGCHAGLDSLAGAFAYYDFDEDLQQVVYTADAVQPKFLRDGNTFRYGFVTLGDSWVNYWRTGPNAHVGWNGPGSGMGAKSFGMEISQTRRFAECQVSKAFAKVCHRTPNGPADIQAVSTIADAFEANGKNMKNVFADAAVHCMGE